MKYVKVTKRNWKKIVKRAKEKNVTVHTFKGGKVKAKNARFSLYTNPSGRYTIIAKKK